METTKPAAQTRIEGDLAILELSGDWTLAGGMHRPDHVLASVNAKPEVARIGFDASELGRWDSVLLTFIRSIERDLKTRSIEVSYDGLPAGTQRMLALANAVPPRAGAGRSATKKPLLDRIGEDTKKAFGAAMEFVDFVGEAITALVGVFTGKARFKLADLYVVIEEVGARALPVVGLIAFLAGTILAFIGGAQLAIFGAEIFVANLVTVGMAREMGALMVGVIMAGRTGAAFAAELGTMQVNEEIDALRTLGISPMASLVLPRMLAMILMMPVLAVYAIALGLLGGGVIGIVVFDLSASQYYYQSLEFVSLKDFLAGLFKALVFGVIVALSGCLRGMQCGRSSAAVGQAATSAVVTGIVLIVVATAVLSVVYHVLGI